MEIHERLKIARERSELKQIEVAEAIGIKQQQISRMESGKFNPRIDLLTDLCKLYKVSADYILGLPRGMKYP